jgi:hypothetical protein
MLASASLAADNKWLGTWKLNPDKSQFSPGPGLKSAVFTYEQDGDKIRRIAEGVNPEGKPFSARSSIKWDGQDHEVEAVDGTPITVAVRTLNDRTLEVTVKNNGKVTTTARVLMSRDGKTVTSTETGVNAKGEKVRNVVVVERQ